MVVSISNSNKTTISVMKPLKSTNIKPLLSATLLVFLFEGCMHGSLPMNMDVEQREASSEDPKSCLPGVFRKFVELIEDERALREIKYFFNNHPQSLATVYTWKEEDPEEGVRHESNERIRSLHAVDEMAEGPP